MMSFYHYANNKSNLQDYHDSFLICKVEMNQQIVRYLTLFLVKSNPSNFSLYLLILKQNKLIQNGLECKSSHNKTWNSSLHQSCNDFWSIYLKYMVKRNVCVCVCVQLLKMLFISVLDIIESLNINFNSIRLIYMFLTLVCDREIILVQLSRNYSIFSLNFMPKNSMQHK